MKKILLLIAILLMGFLLAPDPAKCSYCPGIRCFDSGSCGPGCACAIPGGKISGFCFSFGGDRDE